MVRQGTRDLEVDILANKSRHPASGELDLAIPELVLEAMHRNPSLVGAVEATPAVAAAVRKRYSGPLLATPLRQGNRISGALYLDALTMPEWSRSEDMLALLSVIGDIASLALNRARLQAELLSEQRMSEARRSGTGQVGGEGESIHADHELELAARLEEAHQVSETQANLARGLVHDVRSIASVIRSNIELAGRELPAEAMAAAALREAAHYGRNLVELAEDIATLSQLQEGAQVLHTERVDVGTLIEETVAAWADHAADRGILTSRVMPTPLIVVVDRTILGRVLGHLIGNSLRSAADGGRVLITARASAHTVDIVVNDSDSDQPLEVLATASQGAEPSEEDARHQSVWIDFCRVAIEAHGGSLRVEGREGEPSRYIITLPGALHVARGGPATMEQDTCVTPAPHGNVTPHLGSETEPGK
jgi:signal transduction histidine kinase